MGTGGLSSAATMGHYLEGRRVKKDYDRPEKDASGAGYTICELIKLFISFS